MNGRLYREYHSKFSLSWFCVVNVSYSHKAKDGKPKCFRLQLMEHRGNTDWSVLQHSDLIRMWKGRKRLHPVTIYIFYLYIYIYVRIGIGICISISILFCRSLWSVSCMEHICTAPFDGMHRNLK